MRMQYIRDGLDISSDPFAGEDADAVRVWDADTCLVAVAKNDIDLWVYAASDVGHRYSDKAMARSYVSWKHAVQGFGLKGALV